MDRLKAYRIFILEMEELLKFLYSTRFAFAKVGELNLFAGDKMHKQYLEANGFNTKPSGVCNFNKNNISNLEKILIQQTLVRAISALEIFLIDTMRDIFVLNKKPFQEQRKTIQFTHAQLLSLKDTSELSNLIINKMCRSLSAGGFDEIIKTYKKMFDIDLLNIPPGKQKMIEYHDLRHLIVHKLGRIDIMYRKKYKTMNKGGISISYEVLVTCIKDINTFVQKTHELVVARINEYSNLSIPKTPLKRSHKYRIVILDTKANLDILNDDYEFFVDDEYVRLKNILIEKNIVSDNEIEVILAGNRRKIRAYISNLKYLKSNHIIDIIHTEKEGEKVKSKEKVITKKRTSKKRNIQIDNDTLDLIKKHLPEQPWEKSIHKLIAAKLGLKNRIVSKAIRILMDTGIFKRQIDGILIEDN